MRGALVTDFDGTITETDFFTLLSRRYMPQPPADFFGEWRAGRMSHFDAMAAYFAFAPESEEELGELMRDVRPDPSLGAAAERLHRAGWELIVVSAGCSWYIERILATAGVASTVHANPGRIEAGRGLVVEKPRDSRFFCEDVGIDKPAVVRDALSRYPCVAFAGDGPPDIAPALLVDAGMRFARGYLAEELERRGEEFHRFGRWSEIIDRLCQ